MGYHLGLDLGTTYTAAGVERNGVVEGTRLGNRTTSVPSVVFVRDDGDPLVGEAADRRAQAEPERVAREFKRRFGDTTPMILGGSPYGAEKVTALLLRWAADRAAEQQGRPPTAVAVTHPANWGAYKLDLLAQTVRQAGLPEDTLLLPEPAAAAAYYASERPLDPGAVVAVYDLGGGTFDTALVRRDADGFTVIGEPEGLERLGGIDFDEAVLAHVLNSVGDVVEDLDPEDPTVHAALSRLRRECVEAKEVLSSDTEVTVPVVLPDVRREVRLTRSEFEAMIRPAVGDTVAALRRSIESVGAGGDIQAVLLVGGSSRIPLVAQLVTAELGRPVAIDAHPKDSVAFGAAITLAHRARAATGTGPASAGEAAGSAGAASILSAPRGEPPPRSGPAGGDVPVWRRLGVRAAAAGLLLGGVAGAFWLQSDSDDDGAEPETRAVSEGSTPEVPAEATDPEGSGTTTTQAGGSEIIVTEGSGSTASTEITADREDPDVLLFEGEIDALTPFTNDLRQVTGDDPVEEIAGQATLLGSWYALADWCVDNQQGQVGACYDRAAVFLDHYFDPDPRTFNMSTWGQPGAVGGVIADAYDLTNDYLGVGGQVAMTDLMDGVDRPGSDTLCEPSCADVID